MEITQAQAKAIATLAEACQPDAHMGVIRDTYEDAVMFYLYTPRAFLEFKINRAGEVKPPGSDAYEFEYRLDYEQVLG